MHRLDRRVSEGCIADEISVPLQVRGGAGAGMPRDFFGLRSELDRDGKIRKGGHVEIECIREDSPLLRYSDSSLTRDCECLVRRDVNRAATRRLGNVDG